MYFADMRGASFPLHRLEHWSSRVLIAAIVVTIVLGVRPLPY